MSLKEWKNNELNGLLLKKFGILKEEKQINELTAAQKKLPKGLQDAIAKKEGDDTETEEESENLEEISSKREDVENNREQGREGSQTQDDRLHEETLEEEEIEEGGLADTPENSSRAAGRKEGGRYKRMQESIRRTLKESKKLRLKIKR